MRPAAHDPGHLTVFAGHRGDPRFLVGDRSAGGDVAEVLLHFGRRLGIDISGDGDHRVRRAVVGLEPLLHVVERGGVQVFHGADRGPRIRMPRRIGVRRDQLKRLAVRLVLPLPLLVLHHTALLVEFRLIDGAQQVAHPVTFKEEYRIERGSGHVLEVVRAIHVRGAVQIRGAQRTQRLEIVVVEVLASVEHEVFEEMGEPGLARFLVLGAHVIPHVYRNNRRFSILMN